jgi:hypothetical protein
VAVLFGNLGDGGTMRAFAMVAAFASLGAISIGAEAERYAQSHRPILSLDPIHDTGAGGLSQFRLDGVDYMSTGSLEPGGDRAVVVTGRCGDILGSTNTSDNWGSTEYQ